VADVLEGEARRRFLESLSMYERQGTREGLEAAVGAVSGLGVAITVGPGRNMHGQRSTVGTATEISHHLAVLLAYLGERPCTECSAPMVRGDEWQCPACSATAPIGKPRHFSPSTYAAACRECHGLGTTRVPRPDKLITRPDRPLCAGAMHSPGFFPGQYLCKAPHGGHDHVVALAERYGFDPDTTPWEEMTPEARQAFLFGDPEPMPIRHQSRNGTEHTGMGTFPGFYGWVRDWDTGGTYTDAEACPECNGARLRKEYAVVTLQGRDMQALSEMPLWRLAETIAPVRRSDSAPEVVEASLRTARKRLQFLLQVGLGYLHLGRPSSTLSAGEAQRIKLAGLLGSGLTSLTVLLDEPSRGLHPTEVGALLEALKELRDEGNTVIVVEHDMLIVRSADHVVDLGPGAGAAGGKLVAEGAPDQVARADTWTGVWLRGEREIGRPSPRRQPSGWLTVRGARENNLQGIDVRLPLGVVVGVCGVSGSGKSTLLIDTLGRALAPAKQTTSVAREPIDPGAHEAIEGAPSRTIIVDQARAGLHTPAAFLGLDRSIRALYAASEDAHALGLDEKQLARRCSACGGWGAIRMDMGFLPHISVPCETCRGTGHIAEAWQVRMRGVSLPEVFGLTIDEVHGLWGGEQRLTRPLEAARDVGLGYLVLRQPAHSLSGGEAQRLKMAKELCRRARSEALYVLDEPTVGQHLEDVARLAAVLHRLADEGHTAVVVEHHPHLLACCDWLVELGPGGGPDGGRVIAEGAPEAVAQGETPTASPLRETLESAA
jgi:excinuclease ABC subunit A